ncbi:MAG: TonB-dependent receptor [Steroidobacteraceae bacterium]
MLPRQLALLGLVLPMAVLPALAEDAGDAGLETVTVYALRPTPVARVAAAVTVIDAEQAQRALATDIKQLVRDQPGLAVRNDPFRFGLDTFAVRGLGGNRVRVEIDRVPAAGGFAVGSFADTGRAAIDLAFVERVEILRGPASSLYGSDAIGGIVAMTTLRPATLLRASPDAVALRASLGYQGEDQGWHAAAIGATRLGPGELLLGYVRREGRTLRTAAEVRPDPRRYHGDSALLQYALPDLPGGPLLLTAEGERLPQATDVNAFLRLPGRFVNTTALHGEDMARRYRLGLQQSVPRAFGLGDLDWRVYWQGTRTTQDSFETRQAAPPRTPPLHIDRSFDFDARSLGLVANLLRTQQLGATLHEWVFGIAAERTRLEELRDGLQTNLLTGATTKTILGEVLPVRDLPTSDVTTLAAFAQDQVQLGASRWTLIPALRVDDYQLRPRPDRIYLDDNPTAAAVGLHDVSLAPKLGVLVRLGAGTSAFLQYAHGFRSPPPEDVNIGLEIPLFAVRAIPNPDLKAERSDGYELGLRRHGAALDFTASVYDNEYREFIESKVNLGVDPGSGITLFQSQNVARARIHGAELEATLRAGECWPRLRGWSARLAGAWTRGSDLARHQPLNSVGPASGVLALRYDAASGRWGSGLTLTVVGAKRDLDRSRADLYATGGYATLDWHAGMQLGHGLRLDAAVFNLADRAYIEWEDVRGRANGDPLLPYYTRPGRSASLALRWSR